MKSNNEGHILKPIGGAKNAIDSLNEIIRSPININIIKGYPNQKPTLM